MGLWNRPLEKRLLLNQLNSCAQGFHKGQRADNKLDFPAFVAPQPSSLVACSEPELSARHMMLCSQDISGIAMTITGLNQVALGVRYADSHALFASCLLGHRTVSSHSPNPHAPHIHTYTKQIAYHDSIRNKGAVGAHVQMISVDLFGKLAVDIIVSTFDPVGGGANCPWRSCRARLQASSSFLNIDLLCKAGVWVKCLVAMRQELWVKTNLSCLVSGSHLRSRRSTVGKCTGPKWSKMVKTTIWVKMTFFRTGFWYSMAQDGPLWSILAWRALFWSNFRSANRTLATPEHCST